MATLSFMEKPSVAVVILNWNGQRFLRDFLPSIIQHSHQDATIIVADNDSSDDSIAILESYGDQLKIIRLDKNYGFTGGYNRALAQVDVDYFVLLNSDVEVAGNWITPIITFMNAHPDVAACQPKIRSYNDRHLLEHAGAAGGYIDYLGYPFCRGRMYNTLEEDKGQYDTIQDVFWATGACMFIRKKVFQAVGGFDEDFFAHMEEIELCWRIQEMGHRICVVPQSVVYHVGGGTLPKSSPRKTYYNFRNNLMMLHKHLPLSKLIWIIPFRLLLDGIAGIKFLMNGDIGDMLAVIKAHMAFYRSIPSRNKLRVGIKRLVPRANIKGVYSKSIVAAYYIYQKRHFSQLNKDFFS
jgi:GT2 family glycosyltransferase